MKLELITVGIILALCKSGKYCHKLLNQTGDSDVNKLVPMEIQQREEFPLFRDPS